MGTLLEIITSFVPTCFSFEALHASMSLFLTICVLTTTGWCLQRRLLKSPVALSIFQLCLGQVALVVLMYVRSIFPINLNVYEITFIVYGYLFFELQNKKTRDDLLLASQNKIAPFFILWIVLSVTIFRELPQSIMPSTDPDQHLYFTSQILSLGGIPWDQASTGPSPFQYPVGFASLVALWIRIGFFDIRSALVIQPVVQWILAVFVLTEYVQRLASIKRRGWIAFVIMTLIFLFLFPFPYDTRFHHLEGTARISSWAIIATTLISIASRQKVLLLVAPFSIALLAWFNPILAFLPAIAFTSKFLYEFFAKQLQKKFLLGLGFIAVTVPFLDPYYFNLLFSLFKNPSTTPLAPPFKQPTSSFFELGIDHIWSSIVATFHQLHPPYITEMGLVVVTALLLVTGLFLCIYKTYNLLAFLLCLPCLMLIGNIFLGPAFSANSIPIQGSTLLTPYFSFALSQISFLWLIFLTAIFSSAVLASNLLLMSGIIALLFSSKFLLENQIQTKAINWKPRQEFCGCCSFVTSDDEKVFRFLEEQYKTYLAAGRPLDHKTIPKILIPNVPEHINGESWVFPVGAARILPLYKTFPLAFFYGQGNADYTAENYKKQICKDVDLYWLAKRNIRYLFLPSKGRGCIRGLSITDENTVFQSGDARVIRLSKHPD